MKYYDIENGKVDDEKAFNFIMLYNFSSPLIIGFHQMDAGSTPAASTKDLREFQILNWHSLFFLVVYSLYFSDFLFKFTEV